MTNKLIIEEDDSAPKSDIPDITSKMETLKRKLTGKKASTKKSPNYDTQWKQSEKNNPEHTSSENIERFRGLAKQEFDTARKAKPNMDKYRKKYFEHQNRMKTLDDMERKNKWKNYNSMEEVSIRERFIAYLEEKSPAWQRSEGKDPKGGLNKKGVASYRAANPGSKLQTAVTTKPSKLKPGSKKAKRRLSFCRRMKGLKNKLTSTKTANDPNSRVNKSLRKWNC